MNETEFNLLDEKWIVVLDNEGRSEQLSLTEVFARAHELRTLSGEIEAQDAAVLRMLLAVLYAVYLRRDENGQPKTIADESAAKARWYALWQKNHFDAAVIGAYLNSCRAGFNLFDPVRPFFQAPIDKGTDYSAAKLNGELSESGNKPRLFTTVGGRYKDHMSYPEAARWLLYLNAYDDTSSKPSVRGANMASSGAGWLGKLGFVYVRGNNLFETLMLNLVLADENGQPFPDGQAAWELVQPRTEERSVIPLPSSPLEMLTLQSRRILLKRDDEGVSGYRLLGGDIVPKENAFTEQMTAWRFNEDNQWSPRRHDPARVMWRDYSALLVKTGSADTHYREPGVVRWVSELADGRYLPYGKITIAIAGVKYGTNDFFVDDLVQDHLSLNSTLLSAVGDSWSYRIGLGIEKTDSIVKILGTFVKNLIKICGSGDDKTIASISGNVRAEAYYQLDQPFRRWLSSVDPEKDDLETKMNEWMAIAERTVLESGKQQLQNSGEKAFVGKDMKNNSLVAYRKFRAGVFKVTREGEVND